MHSALPIRPPSSKQGVDTSSVGKNLTRQKASKRFKKQYLKCGLCWHCVTARKLRFYKPPCRCMIFGLIMEMTTKASLNWFGFLWVSPLRYQGWSTPVPTVNGECSLITQTCSQGDRLPFFPSNIVSKLILAENEHPNSRFWGPSNPTFHSQGQPRDWSVTDKSWQVAATFHLDLGQN